MLVILSNCFAYSLFSLSRITERTDRQFDILYFGCPRMIAHSVLFVGLVNLLCVLGRLPSKCLFKTTTNLSLQNPAILQVN